MGATCQFKVRAVAFPIAAASVRIFFIRASGLNGLPFTMPMAASDPMISGSSAPTGSFCTTSLSISK